MKKIKLLHSFPKHETKFIESCKLTFNSKNFDNSYVDELSVNIDLNDFNAIVLHSLRYNDCLFLVKSEVNIPIIWFFWGAEFFNDGKFYNTFLTKKSIRIRRKVLFSYSLNLGLYQLIKEFFPYVIDFSRANRNKLAALKKINFVVPVVPGDYVVLKKKYNLTAKLFHLNYVNPLIDSYQVKNIERKNILLGNSSSYANNHFEAIDKLAELNLEDRKVIIPLNYGDKILSSYVANYALIKLGVNNVIILKNFLSFTDYNDLLLSCEFIFMNHKRQQAVGNIVQGFLNGCHVYLRRESTVYQYLKDCGFIVSALNDVKYLTRLSKDTVELNRFLARKFFGQELQDYKVKMLIKQVFCE
jgi:hypothetical protein